MTTKKNTDDDVDIKIEDQAKINRFAINNTKLHEYLDDLTEKRKELQNLSDALDELITFDENETVPYQQGEVFTYLRVEEANAELEKAKLVIEKEIQGLEDKVSETKKVLSELKTQLYAKFGNKINLEENDD